MHTCLWKLGNVFQVERQLKAPFVCPYNKKKALGEVEEAEEIVYKEKKNVHENFTDYVFAERGREKKTETERGERGCMKWWPLAGWEKFMANGQTRVY